jgi:hypothetical protein
MNIADISEGLTKNLAAIKEAEMGDYIPLMECDGINQDGIHYFRLVQHQHAAFSREMKQLATDVDLGADMPGMIALVGRNHAGLSQAGASLTAWSRGKSSIPDTFRYQVFQRMDAKRNGKAGGWLYSLLEPHAQCINQDRQDEWQGWVKDVLAFRPHAWAQVELQVCDEFRDIMRRPEVSEWYTNNNFSVDRVSSKHVDLACLTVVQYVRHAYSLHIPYTPVGEL